MFHLIREDADTALPRGTYDPTVCGLPVVLSNNDWVKCEDGGLLTTDSDLLTCPVCKEEASKSARSEQVKIVIELTDKELAKLRQLVIAEARRKGYIDEDTTPGVLGAPLRSVAGKLYRAQCALRGDFSA